MNLKTEAKPRFSSNMKIQGHGESLWDSLKIIMYISAED